MKKLIVLCVLLSGCASAPSEHDKLMDLINKVNTIPANVTIPQYPMPTYIYTPNFQMYCGSGVCFGY